MSSASRATVASAGAALASLVVVTRAHGMPPLCVQPTTPAPAAGAPEAMPVAPVLGARVVLVDEGPFRGPRPHAASVPASTREAAHKGAHDRRAHHPAPRIVVDVARADGGSTAADLQRGARNFGYWPFRRCYEAGLRHDQRLSGKVALELTISASGAVQGVQVSSTSLADDSAVLCVAREAQHLPFAPAASETRASMTVSLWAGDEPVPVPPPVAHAAELREALRAVWPAIGQCYADGLASQPDAGGPMDLHFRMSGDGEVLDVAEQGDARFRATDVTRCVLGVYRAAKLPRASGAAVRETSFDYSLHFEWAGGSAGLSR